MSTLEITLPDSLSAFVDAQVDVGTYETPSAFFEQLVREAQERRENAIDELVLDAINSSKPTIVVTPDYWAQKRKSVIDRFGSAE